MEPKMHKHSHNTTQQLKPQSTKTDTRCSSLSNPPTNELPSRNPFTRSIGRMAARGTRNATDSDDIPVRTPPSRGASHATTGRSHSNAALGLRARKAESVADIGCPRQRCSTEGPGSSTIAHGGSAASCVPAAAGSDTLTPRICTRPLLFSCAGRRLMLRLGLPGLT